MKNSSRLKKHPFFILLLAYIFISIGGQYEAETAVAQQSIPILPTPPSATNHTPALQMPATYRDTINISNDSMTLSQTPCVATGINDVPYFVWQDNNDIHFNTLNATSTNVSNSAHLSTNPEIAIDAAENIHIVWQENDAGYPDIYYTVSEDGGLTWASPSNLSNQSTTPYNNGHPTLTAATDGSIHVVWAGNTATAPYNFHIFHRSYKNGGWSNTTDVSGSIQSNWWSLHPNIAAGQNGRVSLVWWATHANNAYTFDAGEIYHKRWTGASWIEFAMISNGNNQSVIPSIDVDQDGTAHVAWQYNLNPGTAHGNIFYRYKPLFEAWSATEDVSTLSQDATAVAGAYPSIAAKGLDKVSIAWPSADGNGNHYVNYSHRQAPIWSPVAQIATQPHQNGANPARCWLAQSDLGPHLTFAQPYVVPNDTSDIFYTRLKDCTNATATQPILMVTGFSGSVDKHLADDEQLHYFETYLEPHGYVYGCNLFYAIGTSPHNWQTENAAVIRDNLCTYYNTVEDVIPNWSGHFDIIAHSYGGPRSRAYLEEKVNNGQAYYEQPCPNTGNMIYVDNLFTMGSPHGGEYPLLPFSLLIGVPALNDYQYKAMYELMPPPRAAANAQNLQPAGTCYHLLAGDARWQLGLDWGLDAIHALHHTASFNTTPNDWAVHDYSAHALKAYATQYPNTIYQYTPDLHGSPTWENSLLRSFVRPGTTFDLFIQPNIGSTDCVSNYTADAPTDFVGLLNKPQIIPPQSLRDLSAGQLAKEAVITGQFEVTDTGPTAVTLFTVDQGLELTLTAPSGTPMTPTVANNDPNIAYLELDSGMGILATYQITNTVTGTWHYTVTNPTSQTPIIYRLIFAPTTPIGVGVATASWVPFDTPVAISATVVMSEPTGIIPIVGGQVTATIQRPDTVMTTLTLHDDGLHNDGAANDGVFGHSYTQTNLGGLYSIQITAVGTHNNANYLRTTSTNFIVGSNNANFNGQYSHAWVDDDGDGYEEWLDVNIGINVTQVSTFSVSADLFADTTYIDHSNVAQITLSPGSHTISLRFSHDAITSNLLDPPYTLRNLLLTETSQTRRPLEVIDNAYTFGTTVDHWQETTKLLANNTNSYYFGKSVAVDGNTAVIGAFGEGAAYVFVQDSNGSWIQQAKLIPNDLQFSTDFGYDVAIDDDTLVIGDRTNINNGSDTGAAYIFVHDGNGNWSQQAKLTPNDGTQDGRFGNSVTIHENTVIIGAYKDNNPKGYNAGAAYVFVRDSNDNWNQQAKLMADDGSLYSWFGHSVAVSEETVIISAIKGGYGAAYIFTDDGNGNWSQHSQLTANDSGMEDYFGNSLAIDNDTAVIGAYYADNVNGSNVGAAYIFTRDSNGNWIQQTKLVPINGTTNENFGKSVAIKGNTVVVGAYYNDNVNGIDAGSAYIFTHNNDGNWYQQTQLIASDGATDDLFGHDVAIGDRLMIVGASQDNDNGTYSGSAYIFEKPITSSQIHFSDDVEATVTAANNTQITTTVPFGFIAGPISVEAPHGTSNGVPFTNGSATAPDASGQANGWATTFSGNITTDTTWSQNILLTGDVQIGNGATLTITPGVTIFFSANSDDQTTGSWSDKVELNVYGTLMAEGSEAAPIYFVSNAATPAPSDWGGINIRHNSTNSSLSHCFIQHAINGVHFRDKKLGGGTISGQVSNCTLINNKTGIYMYGNPGYPQGGLLSITPTIINNHFINNVNYGLYLQTTAGYGTSRNNALIENNVITGSETGIYLHSNSWWAGHAEMFPIIRNNTIRNHTNDGLYIKAMGSSDSSGSDTDVKPIIENNLFKSNGSSHIYLLLDPYGSDGTQILQPTIRYNTMREAPKAIVVDDTASYDTLAPTIHTNLFHTINSYVIDNLTSRTIIAQANYWGNTEASWDAGPQAGDTNGLVDSSNHLDTTAVPLLTRIESAIGQPGDTIVLYGANLGTFLP